MWSDNETHVDLLGFSVHKNLIRQLVTNSNLLPITVGIFGDWGGGKSSILRMLEQDLNNEKLFPDVACLYFSGWMFEGYDDAKAALISSVLLQLGEHKRFGPKVRDRVVSFLKRVDLMRVLPLVLKHAAIPVASALTVTAAAHGLDAQTALGAVPLVGGLAATMVSPAVSVSGSAGASSSLTKGTASVESSANPMKGEEPIDWLRLVREDKSTPTVLDVRSFQRDFGQMLADTDLQALVVLIDDLDRCMPDRLIENLEAIRLFLAVPKTAFVIAADERIIRHAVSIRYVETRLRDEKPANQERYDLITDYIEKLIQVPYHLPRLSPSEIETYMTLLFCQLHLVNKGEFDKVLTDCQTARERNLYRTFGAGMVRDALGGNLPGELGVQLQWAGAVAPAFAEGLKGNPRQVKRFLNALMLRRQLAVVAKLAIHDDVLVKLMLLEYTRPDLFDQLYTWQARSEGQPPEIGWLEDRARHAGVATVDQAQVSAPLPAGASSQWDEKAATDWLKLDPVLAKVDLRDYFWIARDKLKSTASGLTMLSPLVRSLFEALISSNEGERQIAAKESKGLDSHETAELLRVLDQHIRREAESRTGVDGLLALIEGGTDSAVQILLTALSSVAPSNLDPSIAYDLQMLVTAEKVSRTDVLQLLADWSKTQTRIGAASKRVLQDLGEAKGTKG